MTLERIAPGAARREFVPLLQVADDSPLLVETYVESGDLHVLRGDDHQARAIVLMTPAPDQAVELKAVAVAPDWQRRGIGSAVLAHVLAEFRVAGVRRVIVGTATCNIGALAFYQRAGFRLWRIERDYFTRARGYPDGLTEHGIPLRDMVWMDQEL